MVSLSIHLGHTSDPKSIKSYSCVCNTCQNFKSKHAIFFHPIKQNNWKKVDQNGNYFITQPKISSSYVKL